jgi:small subunit ribosomal protein S4e
MVQSHLARLAAPKRWTLARKEYHWTARPTPGPHAINECITINLILRDLLEHAKTAKEIQTILYNGNFLVDKTVRKDYKFPVGLMDVVEIPKMNETFRVMLDDMGRFFLLPIDKSESALKLLKIINKRMIKGGKMQLTFHDGRTIIADKFEGNVGDSVLFDLEKKKIVELLKLEKGALMLLNSGKHVGTITKIKDILITQDLQRAKVAFEENGQDITTLMDYAFVVGKDKPVIKLVDEAKKKAAEEKKAQAKSETKKSTEPKAEKKVESAEVKSEVKEAKPKREKKPKEAKSEVKE